MDALAELVESLPAGVVATDPATRGELSLRLVPATPAPARRSRWSGPRKQTRCRRRCAGPRTTGSRSSLAEPAPGSPAAPARSTAASCSAWSGCAAIEIDPDCQVAVVEPGAFNARGQGGLPRARALVPARPVVVRDLLHRRQRRDQRRWPVLREVRRHHRLRPRPRRGARGRHPGHPRRQAHQGRRRAVAAQALRRFGGHARHRHARDPAAGPAAPAACDPGRLVRDSVGGGRRGRRRRTPHAAALDDGADGPGVDQRGRGLPPRGLDRSAGALLLVQSDAPGTPASPRSRRCRRRASGRCARGRRDRRPGGGGDVRGRAARRRSRRSRPAAPCCSRT